MDGRIAERVAARFLESRQTTQDDIDTVVGALRLFCRKYDDADPPGWPGTGDALASRHWGPDVCQTLSRLKRLINQSKLQAPDVEVMLDVGKGLGVKDPGAAIRWVDEDLGTRALPAFHRILEFLEAQPKSAVG